ncbi:MAG: DUF3127 domain-containing protein [Bacteroidales bacterium]|nr:DUF3127 domain-containing protein [Bacteroidales bacterium]
MSLEITGSFVSKQEQQKGTSAKGEWVKQDFIVEIQEGQYPRKICLTAFGDNKIRLFDGINIGEQIKVSIDINSREFNGRWYTDISPWRVERVGAAVGATGADSAAIPPPPMDAPTLSAPMDAGDDLPF